MTVNHPLFTVALQALDQDDDDSFTNSSWADTRSLKQHFSGVGNVRIPK
jgi:hypothetical protein